MSKCLLVFDSTNVLNIILREMRPTHCSNQSGWLVEPSWSRKKNVNEHFVKCSVADTMVPLQAAIGERLNALVARTTTTRRLAVPTQIKLNFV